MTTTATAANEPERAPREPDLATVATGPEAADDGDIRSLLFLGEDQSQDEAALLSAFFLAVLRTRYNVLAIKIYRISLGEDEDVPVTPCLDHETSMRDHADPHVGAYVQDRASGAITAVTYVPGSRLVVIEEETPGASAEVDALRDFISRTYLSHRIRVRRLQRRSAQARAHETAEAHLPLADVLTEEDVTELRRRLARAQGLAPLMEKVSRVSSWGIRTAYAPLAAAIAFLLVLVLPVHGEGVAEWTATDWARAGLLAVVGAGFLYIGLKAVQLTKSAMRLQKRFTEYDQMLTERARVLPDAPRPEPPVAVAKAADAVRAQLGVVGDDVARIARLVTAYRACADVAAGARVSAAPAPLAGAVARLRLEQLEVQRRGLRASLAGTAQHAPDPPIVARRREASRRLRVLDAKAAALEALAARAPAYPATS